ncbi:histidine kinase N-terminal 7TM domain-containing protein (plasmid) [Haloferax sp. S1W]|uniref:histidine kinase N-terminal 7TM domain-containing protein n=1 Tax=Haloferax sp. S1W TaxID=3377110 RepID=UPI0037C7EE9E
MTWQHTIFAYPTLFATFVSVLLGGYSFRYILKNGRTPVLSTFLAVNVGLALWTGFAAVKLLSTDPVVKLSMYRLLYLGVAPLGSFAVLFALAYTGRDQWLRAPVIAGLLGVSALYLVLLFVNPFGVAFESTRVFEANGLVVMRVDVGIAHLVLQTFYNALLSVAAVGIIGYEAMRLGRSYVPQAILVSTGVAAPFIFVVLSALGVPPFQADGVNLIPTSAAVTSTALGVAIFRYRFLDLPPIAYTTAMEESPDGVLVLDTNDRIVHANDRGSKLLASFDAALGDSVDEVFPDFELSAQRNDSLRIDLDGKNSAFLSIRSQHLVSQERVVGWVIILRDVTELHQQKQIIEEQNEKLALLNQIVSHDIHNDMSVVLGNARLVEEMVDDEVVQSRLETMIRNSEHAAELTDTVRNLMTTMRNDDDETTRPVSVGSILLSEVNSVRAGNKCADVSLPGDLDDVRVLADDMLGTVFRNLLTNAIRHNDTDVPEIDVTVEAEPAHVVVRIADNGPGIPDDKKDEIFGRGNKGLESPGAGIGLYLVDTIVTGYGGDVQVVDNDSRGAVFVVRLRRPDSRESDELTKKALGS